MFLQKVEDINFDVSQADYRKQVNDDFGFDVWVEIEDLIFDNFWQFTSNLKYFQKIHILFLDSQMKLKPSLVNCLNQSERHNIPWKWLATLQAQWLQIVWNNSPEILLYKMLF